MFSSFAAWSSSSSIGDAKSTLTRWIGPVMWPEFVKKRETSFLLSARRAMVSAATGCFRLRVLFRKLVLLFRSFPQSHEVVILSFLVLPRLKDERVQFCSHGVFVRKTCTYDKKFVGSLLAIVETGIDCSG